MKIFHAGLSKETCVFNTSNGESTRIFRGGGGRTDLGGVHFPCVSDVGVDESSFTHSKWCLFRVSCNVLGFSLAERKTDAVQSVEAKNGVGRVGVGLVKVEGPFELEIAFDDVFEIRLPRRWYQYLNGITEMLSSLLTRMSFDGSSIKGWSLCPSDSLSSRTCSSSGCTRNPSAATAGMF